MGQFTVSLPDDLERQVRSEVARGGYSTVSGLVTEALREKVGGARQASYWDRVSITVQLENRHLIRRLLAAQGLSTEIDEISWREEPAYQALTDGYPSWYQDAFEYVYKDELSDAETRFVYDVLDMYLDLQWSCRENGGDLADLRLLFPGFDGNYETRLMSFVRFLRRAERYEHLESAASDFNSHGFQPDYRAMVSRYKEVRSTKDRLEPMTVEEIALVSGRA